MMVYKQYDQQELDNQYNTRLHVPDYSSYFKNWEEKSAAIHKKYSCVTNLAYGFHADESIDIFPAQHRGSKTLIFIHGGFWHLLDKNLFHFLTKPFSENGLTCAFINYRLAPAANMDEIVTSCSDAVMWIYKNISGYNGDPNQLYVLGHSAGGHLASMLLTRKDFSFLKGVVSLSGLFRLEPVMKTYLNEVLHMDIQIVNRNSPVLLNKVNSSKLLLLVGSEESDEFKDQSIDLTKSWQAKREEIQCTQVQTANHYSILDKVIEKGSLVQRSIFQLMNI